MSDDDNRQFPWKLHDVLAASERNGYTHIISWLPDGDAFMVNDKVEFANEIMPKYFNSKKFKTFQRNLNLWGFRTLTKNPNKGAVFHPDFLRSNPDQCNLMKRIRIRKKSPKMTLEEFQASRTANRTPPASRTLSSDTTVAPLTNQPTNAVAQLPTPPSGLGPVVGPDIPLVRNAKALPGSDGQIHPNFSMANHNNNFASLPPSCNGLMAMMAATSDHPQPNQQQQAFLQQALLLNNLRPLTPEMALELVQRQLGMFLHQTNNNSSSPQDQVTATRSS